jgi:hypothetical protein
MAGTPKKKKWKGIGRVTFLAHIEPIREQLEAGWPRIAIHQKMEAELDISYPQFLRYVREYIKKSDVKPKGVNPGIARPSPSKAAGANGKAEKPKQEQQPRGFVFDPTAVDRKDLI